MSNDKRREEHRRRQQQGQDNTFVSTGAKVAPAFLNAFNKGKTKDDLVKNGKKLVVIQLSGGNDGLNTIVPFRNDIYYQQRPNLAIPSSKVLRMSSELGFNPVLAPLRSIYGQGQMSIINSVGYPNPNRSHFRSMDIWQTGSASNAKWKTGWIGRYLDATCKGYSSAHVAVSTDDELDLALKGTRVSGMAVDNMQLLKETISKDNVQLSMENFLRNPNRFYNNPNAAFIYKTLVETVSSVEYIYEKTKIQRVRSDYPKSQLGKQLRIAMQMMLSGVGTQIYYVTQTGFDTHIKQEGRHNNLMEQYAKAVSVFVDDLKKHGLFDNTLIMTFSEFGRRVKENESMGTDHGTANNVMVIGKNLRRAGFYNRPSNLTNLDQGDLRFEIDFRQIYATLLERWLGNNDLSILRGMYKPLDFL